MAEIERQRRKMFYNIDFKHIFYCFKTEILSETSLEKKNIITLRKKSVAVAELVMHHSTLQINIF